MNKFIAIVGSNSNKSTNRELLKYMQRHFQPQAEIELVEIAVYQFLKRVLISMYLKRLKKLPKKLNHLTV